VPKRIIDISSEGCYLKYQNNQLIIEREGEKIGKVPIEDMSAIIIDHPQALITQVCLSKLVAANVMVVCSDEKHQPVGLFLPLESNTLQSERFTQQASLGKSVKKRIWKQLIIQKIRLQGQVLKDITGKDAGLWPLAKKVRSGDPENIEAQAARRYWARLFQSFKRDREAEDQNRYLNYGYAVLRALVARSLCATGLHPCLGIHHHNRYNAYALADDVMEPYRPYIDTNVWRIVEHYGQRSDMDKALREELLQFVKMPLKVEEETVTMQAAIRKTVQSLSKIVQGRNQQLVLPTIR
jgi:CRISPR-associated protein Cas1